MQVGRVSVRDIEIEYAEAGSGDRPFVLVHGFTGSRDDWREHVAPLSELGRTIAIDQRGHGGSTNVGEAAGYTFPELIADSYRKLSPEFAEELRELSLELGPAPFLNDLRACDRFDVIERLGEIDVPVLAIVGTEDVMTPPKYSTFLEEHIPDASARIIDGGTHFVFAEYPDQVNQAIADFLDSLSASS